MRRRVRRRSRSNRGWTPPPAAAQASGGRTHRRAHSAGGAGLGLGGFMRRGSAPSTVAAAPSPRSAHPLELRATTGSTVAPPLPSPTAKALAAARDVGADDLRLARAACARRVGRAGEARRRHAEGKTVTLRDESVACVDVEPTWLGSGRSLALYASIIDRSIATVPSGPSSSARSGVRFSTPLRRPRLPRRPLAHAEHLGVQRLERAAAAAARAATRGAAATRRGSFVLGRPESGPAARSWAWSEPLVRMSSSFVAMSASRLLLQRPHRRPAAARSQRAPQRSRACRRRAARFATRRSSWSSASLARAAPRALPPPPPPRARARLGLDQRGLQLARRTPRARARHMRRRPPPPADRPRRAPPPPPCPSGAPPPCRPRWRLPSPLSPSPSDAASPPGMLGRLRRPALLPLLLLLLLLLFERLLAVVGAAQQLRLLLAGKAEAARASRSPPPRLRSPRPARASPPPPPRRRRGVCSRPSVASPLRP